MIHRSRSRRLATAAVAVAALMAAVMTSPPSSAQPAAAGAAAPPAPTVVAPGTVSAFFETDLYAKESGYVTEIRVDIGDHVRKGAELAVIDAPELRQRLASVEAMVVAKEAGAKAAEAAVQQAKALVEVARRQLAGYEADRTLARATLKRQEALFAGQAATGQQMDEMRAKAEGAAAAADVGRAKIASAEADLAAAEANRAVAAAQVRVAAADVEGARTLLAYTRIVAPFDGVVTRRLVNPGDLVQAATASRTTPLFTCHKLDVVRVFCEVPEASAAGVRPGVRADVRLFGPTGQTVSGVVTRVATSMDPGTRTMRAEIDLPNPTEALRPGMYAQVTLTPQPAPPAAEAAPPK